MSLSYKIVDARNDKVIAITDDLYGIMKELLDDEYVEDFINETEGLPSIPHLDSCAGTILRFLAETGEHEFQNAWELARQDFLAISYDAVNDGIDWERCAYYEHYRITPVIEGS